jgi:hypothetical protein
VAPEDQRQIGLVVIVEEASGPDLLREVLDVRASGRVGVSPVYADYADTARDVRFADLALGCLPPGSQGVAGFDDHPIGTLVASSPELSERLVHGVLGPVLALEGEERDTLIGTLRTWIDEAGSVGTTAERLFCHRNTIRNRMQRIEALTNRSLADPAALTEVCLAMTALALALG